MLNNFIHAKTKSLFLEHLGTGSLPDEAIGFIEDSKEIWNRGVFYGGKNKEEEPKVIEISYEDLVTTKDSNKLIPGQQYRIIDYVTKIPQINDMTSLEHPFDIIVTAINENTLDVKAKAAHNSQDTYFKKSDLNSWQLWYDLIPTSENSVIMDISQLPLGIETLTFYPTDKYEYQGTEYYAFTNVLDGISFYVLSEDPLTSLSQPYIVIAIEPSSGEAMDFSEHMSIITINISDNNNKGCITRMIDEFDNDCPYDFKNIKFGEYFTFSSNDGADGLADASLSGTALNNKIHPLFSKYQVPKNTFITNYGKIAFNVIGNNSSDNEISNYVGDISNVIIGQSSIGNNIRYDSYNTHNVAATGSLNIKIGNNSSFNSVSGTFITIGDNSNSNSSDRTRGLIIGDRSNSNEISLSDGVTIGDDCNNNHIFQSDRSSILNYSSDNNLTKYSDFSYLYQSSNNSVAGNANYLFYANNNKIKGSYNTFEAGARGNVIYGHHNTFKQGACGNKFSRSSDGTYSRDQVNYAVFDEGCSYNILWNEGYDPEADSEDTYDDYQMNYLHITRGVSGDHSSFNPIYIPTEALNAKCEIKIAKNSSGDIKIYCEADLIK